MDKQQRLVFLGIAAVIAVVAIVLLGGSGADEEQPVTEARTTPARTVQEKASPQPTTTTDAAAAPAQTTPPEPAEPPMPVITIEGGEPRSGVERIEVDKGARIRFAVRSDVADRVHVHGYDVVEDLTPGKRVSFSIPATITGIFEVELEERGVEIAQLRVNP